MSAEAAGTSKWVWRQGPEPSQGGVKQQHQQQQQHLQDNKQQHRDTGAFRVATARNGDDGGGAGNNSKIFGEARSASVESSCRCA